MIAIEKATLEDAVKLTEIQTRTFQDDNKLKPPGCSMEGPPGYDSVDWNAGWIDKTSYFKILFDGQIVGGIIVFELKEGYYELGRIWVDPDFQNRGIGQWAVRRMFDAFPEARKWILGTPSWAIRNQHLYEKMGFVRVRETEVDPDLGWSGVEYEKTVQVRAAGWSGDVHNSVRWSDRGYRAGDARAVSEKRDSDGLALAAIQYWAYFGRRLEEEDAP